MSTQPPTGPPRRRRIAGERRGRAPGVDQPTFRTAPPDPAPTTGPPPEKATGTSPVALSKKPLAARATSARSEVAAPAADDRGAESTVGAEVGRADRTSRASSGWWGSPRSLLVLAALLVVLLLLTGLAALGKLGTDSVEEVSEADAAARAARTAPAAAEAAAAAILAYDFRSLEADQDAASRFMTDEFASQYSETFEKVVAPTAEENRARVTATVLASSTMRSTGDTAKVLLFVDQATVSRLYDRPQVALNRVEMSMVREGDDWLVADLSSY